MQIGSLNSAPASASSASSAPAAPEPTGSRAEHFARVLKSAFFGASTKAVSQGAERSAPEAAPRQELRQDTRSTSDTGNGRNTEYRDTASSDSARQPAPRETNTTNAAPRQPAAKPSSGEAAPVESKEGEAPATEVAAEEQAASQPAETDTAAEETAKPAEPATVVETAPDAAVILALLQGEVPPMPVTGDTAVPSVVVEATAVAPAVDLPDAALAKATAIVPAVPTLPVTADKAAIATQPPVSAEGITPALPPVVAEAAQAQAEVVLPEAAAAGMAKATAASATATSAAALLLEQEAVTPEDFAAIQQALTLQQQKSAARLPADATSTTEGKPGDGKTIEAKAVTVQVQTAQTPTPKTLVDQSALLTMQGDEAAVDPAALPPQQMPAAQPQPQMQPQADVKFAAALQGQISADLPPAQGHLAHSPAHLSQQAMPTGAPAAQAPQATQHATMQAAARHLSAYMPAGEQVAVQIKRGVTEGLDKISIRLDPGNLGKVEVKMEVSHDGRLMAVVAADKPETLAMLQKDVASLEQSLRDAGLKTDSSSLSFTLRDQGQAGEGRDGREGQTAGRGRLAGHDDYAEGNVRPDPVQVAAANAQRAAAARGGLDIRI